MNKPAITRWLWPGLFFASVFLSPAPGRCQELYYATSSATQANNTVDYTFPSGGPAALVFSANGADGQPQRCTALAVDPMALRIFFVDAQGQGIWGMNLDGSALGRVTAVSGIPTDIALDTVHQQIYFTTSSYGQTSNTIQTVSYSGVGGATKLFTATGPGSNGVSRCTALAVDVLHSQIFFSDAGANAIWSIPMSGSQTATPLIKYLPGPPLDLALDVTNEFVYYVTSGTVSNQNTVERIDYAGMTNVLLYASPPGTNGIHRCTGLDFNPSTRQLYVADAGSNVLWSLNSDGSGLAAVEGNVQPFIRRVRVAPFTRYFVVNLNDSGPGSLRGGLLNGSLRSIVFSGGLFTNGSGVVQLDTVGDNTYGPSAFIITNQVSITGPVGSNGVVIARSNGAPAMRLFYIAPGGSLTLSNVMLTNGLAQGGAGGGATQRGGGGGGAAGIGGAIFNNNGTLDLENSTLAYNQALGGAGGGAGGGGAGSGGGGGGLGGAGGLGGQFNIGGTGGGPNGGGGGNSGGGGGGVGGGGGGGGSSETSGEEGAGGPGGFGGGGGGGGAYNTVGYGGGPGGAGGMGGFGGGAGGPGGGANGVAGIPGFAGGASSLTFDQSGNYGSSGGGGGGLGGAVFSLDGVMTVTNCTFSQNAAIGGPGGDAFLQASNGLGFGGAIFNLNSSLLAASSTFAYNRADQGGGGICNLGTIERASSVVLRNSILADTLSGASDYLSTNAFNGSSNSDLGASDLIQVNDGFNGTLVSTADPRLTPLQNNGGPTLTHALLNQSPALDAGNNHGAPATDQRGYPRIVDGLDTGAAVIDLGAVEDGLVRLTTPPQTALQIEQEGVLLSLRGETNRSYVIESSTDLTGWNPVSTNLMPSLGFINIFDTSSGGVPGPRFYRAFAQP